MLPPLSLSLQIANFDDAACHRSILARHRVRRWLRHAMQADVRSAEITVRVVGEPEGLELNSRYRHRDYATNVLTFGYSGAPQVAADLVLCGPVVAREAREQGKQLLAHYAHLIVHGALHAQGWDHEIETEARDMEALESTILKRLGLSDPWAN